MRRGDQARHRGDSASIAPIVGHVGDGNFHVQPLVDMDDPARSRACEAFIERLVERALAMEGTCTGEHGVGQKKMKYLEAEHGPEALDLMRALKRALDPHNIMNPGQDRCALTVDLATWQLPFPAAWVEADQKRRKGRLLRDILTVIASLVILVLAAPSLAPPFIDWEAQRDTHRPGDRRAPRARRPRPRAASACGCCRRRGCGSTGCGSGGRTPASPSLTADFVWSEIALTPLLRGEVRFPETRVGRADIRIPVGGRRRLAPAAGSSRRRRRSRDWAIENLTVAQLLVTTQVPSTGRTDQFYAESVAIEGQKLLGPWRIEGMTAGVPFRLVTGELAPDETVQVKLSGGGDVYPRFDIDAQARPRRRCRCAAAGRVRARPRSCSARRPRSPRQASRSRSRSRRASRPHGRASSSIPSRSRPGRAARACA